MKVPEGFLPEGIFLNTYWGMAVIRDNSPTKNTLEIRLSVPNLKGFLGLSKLEERIEVIAKGTMTNNQLMRGIAGLLLKLSEKTSQDTAEERIGNDG